jgi:DNA-binding transcriptional LysR family regulator
VRGGIETRGLEAERRLMVSDDFFRSKALNGGIDLKHLRCALVAAELQSFSKAAAQMGVKNATLSSHISYLEQKCGAALFVRTARGVSPTEAGKAFLRAARRILDQMNDLYERTRAISDGRAGLISIGFITSITAGNLRSSIFAFEEAFPQIDVRSWESERSLLVSKLHAGALDILVASGASSIAGMLRLSLWSERIVAVLPADHPLTVKDHLHWSDLEGETIIAPHTTIDVIQAVIASKVGYQRLAELVKPSGVSRESVFAMVGARRGITISSTSSTGAKIDNVIYRDLYDNDGPHLLNFSAYWRPDNENPALRSFLCFLRDRYSLAGSGC